ncbi:MAG: hypothetical protein HWN67_11315 [Candidatus Helarchaeota archaeon]|nr:hypothetical protein [Candidatus Helarchaeota archaeon]
MVENNKACGLGILLFILSLVSAFLWTYNYPLYQIFYGLGAALFCVSGLLFLIGGYQNNYNIVASGFGIGLAAWSLILISSFLGFHWNQNGLVFNDIIGVIILIHIHKQDFSEQLFFYNLILSMISGKRRYRIGYFGSIVHIPFAIVAFILGSLILYSVREEKW